MQRRSKLTSIFIFLAFTLPLMSGFISASSSSLGSQSYAFLPSWNGYIPSDLSPGGESFTSAEFNNHDYDDSGNLYYMESEDYYQYWFDVSETTSQRGFHLFKVDTNGSSDLLSTIQCNNYCNSPDYYYSKVVGLHVLEENRLFVVMSVYNNYLTFDGQQNYASSHNLVTAFYDNGSWAWNDIEQTSTGYAYGSLVYQDLTQNGDLFVVLYRGTSGNWAEYDVMSYSENGTNWVRTLEIPYNQPTYNNLQPIFDVSDGKLEIFSTVKSEIKWDSQSVNCDLGGESDYCHFWLTIDSSGSRSQTVKSLYTSISFTDIEVSDGALYLVGNTYDYVSSSHTESNFTGQKISHSPNYGNYVAVLDNQGSWDYHSVVNLNQNSYQYGYLAGVMEDGSILFNGMMFQDVYLNGSVINEFSGLVDAESMLMRVNTTTGIQWTASIGFDNPSAYPFDYFSDGKTAVVHITHPSQSNGEVYYQYQGSNQGLETSSTSTSYQILWIELESGSVVDVENTNSNQVNSRSLDGGVLASTSGQVYYYMPDFDGDNVGTGDNCPDDYNPDQNDLNQNGIGDACDEDDDSDGVEDSNDLCPQGVQGWSSDSLTDNDGDGCKDRDEEDLDDDNDGIPDITDVCPVGVSGAGNDMDGDGCKDFNDPDDDGDLVRDESDLCAEGEIDWSSGTLTDHDGDGCKDDHEEDQDDDNDGVADSIDACPKGAINWPSNINTDFDEDGCRDGFEDEDDDGDGISNVIDDCPRSIGVVNVNGCSATQVLDEGDSGGSAVYYVCSTGSVVVLDPSDCPQQDMNNTNDPSSSVEYNETFYYVCPGGTDVVTDLSECEGSITEGGNDLNIVIDPDSNSSENYVFCDGNKVIALSYEDCPNDEQQQVDGTANNIESNGSSGFESVMMFVMFGMISAVLVLLVLRKPQQMVDVDRMFDQSENIMTKVEPVIPSIEEKISPPPKPSSSVSGKPSSNMIGVSHGGQEWLEWPEGSDNHWYREIGLGGDWNKYNP